MEKRSDPQPAASSRLIEHKFILVEGDGVGPAKLPDVGKCRRSDIAAAGLSRHRVATKKSDQKDEAIQRARGLTSFRINYHVYCGFGPPPLTGVSELRTTVRLRSPDTVIFGAASSPRNLMGGRPTVGRVPLEHVIGFEPCLPATKFARCVQRLPARRDSLSNS